MFTNVNPDDIVITVHGGNMSESATAFIDMLRHCNEDIKAYNECVEAMNEGIVNKAKEVEYGPLDSPGILDHTRNDLYAKIGDYVPPKSDNIDIDNIEYGDYEAKRDQNTLWIDPDDVPPSPAALDCKLQ